MPYLINYYRGVVRHAFGRMTPAERTFIPEAEFGRVYRAARIYLLIYLAVALADRHPQHPAAAVHRPADIYGAWMQVVYGIQQHAGLAETCWITA